MLFQMCKVLLAGFVGLTLSSAVSAAEPTGDPQRGWELLRNKAYLPADFDQETFDQLWKSWPKSEREKAESATVGERRRMIFEYYGLIAFDHKSKSPTPIGYSINKQGGWVMNCFACHAGSVAGKTIPGAPNTMTALHTLTEGVRRTKLRLGKPFTHLDVGSLTIPLNTTNGTTNSVMFGVALGNYRNKNMDVVAPKSTAKLVHHDMDAPPWWNVKKKKQLYIDGFSPKNHRVLMQFMLLPLNNGERVRNWENDFRHILAYIESVEVPKYPFEIDAALASKGKVHFENHCAKCHGTYGERETYPEITVPIDEVKTDPVRLIALTATHRQWMKQGWMSRYGQDEVIVEPKGYVAPPLNGIWASAPYFHNGSVPTLWHVLHPDQRPKIWKRTSVDGYDQQKVGLEVDGLDAIPSYVKTAAEKRWYFDTSKFGKSNRGHDYPNVLNEDEKTSLLEYLKSL